MTYVGQFSRYGFVAILAEKSTASAEETVEGKLAFEARARRQGVRISNYHADNGIFNEVHLWVDACKWQQQGMSYAGVNAYHQNGIAKCSIRELQKLARAMLMHDANARWKEIVTINLWPYALQYANDAINHAPSFQDSEQKSPVEKFVKTMITTSPKHWKPFRCPEYVLDNDLQGRNPFHKWKHRTKMSIFLGKPPLHGRSLLLVLDRDTAIDVFV